MSGKCVRTILLCAALMGPVVRAADRSAPSTVPLSPPSTSSIPAGPLGDAIRYGQRIVTDTQATVKPYVGNALAARTATWMPVARRRRLRLSD